MEEWVGKKEWEEKKSAVFYCLAYLLKTWKDDRILQLEWIAKKIRERRGKRENGGCLSKYHTSPIVGWNSSDIRNQNFCL